MVRSPGGMSSAIRRVALVALLALPMASCDSSTVVRGAEVQAYLARVANRPAHLRAQELDAALMQSHSASAESAGPTAAAE